MWWQDLLWGLWNGYPGIVLIAHLLGAWDGFSVYNVARSGNWYDLGCVLGAGSPLFGLFSPRRRRSRRER
ncbi:hypothetical protein EO238_31110, partial [Citrobacter sp. AAK_AS5]